MRNRPRILFEYDVKPFTNKRMDAGQFVNSLSIRGWSLGAKVNGLRGLQLQSQEELDALLPSPTGMISVLDRSILVMEKQNAVIMEETKSLLK